MMQTPDALDAPVPLERMHDLTRTAMFAALIAAGAYIVVPIGPVHFTMHSMMVLLAGFCLGPRKAFWAMIIYMAAGFAGLPVLGRGKAGPAAFLSPLGGYYWGFLSGAVVAGLAADVPGKRRRVAAMAVAGLAAIACFLVVGTAGLRLTIISEWRAAFAVGALPFVPMELIKLVVAICIVEAFFPHRSDAGADHDR